MTSQEWQRVTEIYSSALDLPSEGRLGFIASQCGGDERLESQLRKMLEAEDIEEGFLDRPLSLIREILPEIKRSGARLRSGDVLSERFEIIRFLARGGMGEVYEAYDNVLHEPAAIKIIRPEIAGHPKIVELFRHEVSRTRAIRSDQVCPVFDVFEDRSPPEPLIYFSMKLLQGETLAERLERSGPVPLDLAMPVIADIAAGVAAAHREDVIHGDLKSGNVMLVRSRTGVLRAAVTDFGLARKVPEQPGNSPRDTSNTVLGIGTPGYAAPEQARGAPATRLSDIYSLGVVAYEAITGRLPFKAGSAESGEASQSLVAERIPEKIACPCPRNVEKAVLRCLCNRPEDRHPSAEAFLEALSGRKRWSARFIGPALLVASLAGWLAWYSGGAGRVHHPHVPHNSLAVMPFTVPEGGSRDYFSDGFTEELIRTLGGSSELRVIGSDSTLSLRNAVLTPRELGERLNVQYIVFGSVQRQNAQLEVNAKLVRASDGRQLWSETYKRDDTQLPTIRNQIASRIAGALQVSLAGMQPQIARSTSNLQAQDLYWMGRHHWRQRTDASVRTSAGFFEESIARDPTFAAGWSGLADAYAVMAERAIVPSLEGLRKAESAAKKAVSLAPRLPEAWVSLGQVQSLYNRDFVASEQSFRHAIDLQPELSSAHQWYSYMLTKQRRFSEAIDHARRAVNSEPLSVPANINLAVVMYYARRDDEAILQSRKISQLDPALSQGHLITGQVLARQGRVDEAIREMELLPEPAQTHPITIRFWAELYAIAGKRKEAREAIDRMVGMRPQGLVSPFYIASAWATLGENDKAFEWLEQACNEHDGIVSMVHAAPGFDGLRSDPRYPGVLRRLGLIAGTRAN